MTRRQEGASTAADLQVTASAADLSSPRCFDDKMLERFAAPDTIWGYVTSSFTERYSSADTIT